MSTPSPFGSCPIYFCRLARVRLFRRTNSIRQAFDADQAAAANQARSVAPTSVVETEDPFRDAHIDLDLIERQLADIRSRQQLLLEPAKPERKGSFEQLDLRMLIELADDDDEDFERRFDQFAATDSQNSDRSRRWMETH